MMRESDIYPRMIFREPFDERTAFEVSRKGWYNGLTVELEGGSQYEIIFYDPIRLSQDLETEIQQGGLFIADPRMVIVGEINEASMREAIIELYRKGWFKHFRPTIPASEKE
jgi:hypothetical protein